MRTFLFGLDPNRVKLEASGDLSIFYKNDEVKSLSLSLSRSLNELLHTRMPVSQDDTKKVIFLRLTLFSFDLSCDQLLTEQRFDFLSRIVFTLFTPLSRSLQKKKQPMGYVRASQKKEATVQRKQHAMIANPKTTKQLLGDLYEDRVFLDKIINNSSKTFPCSDTRLIRRDAYRSVI